MSNGRLDKFLKNCSYCKCLIIVWNLKNMTWLKSSSSWLNSKAWPSRPLMISKFSIKVFTKKKKGKKKELILYILSRTQFPCCDRVLTGLGQVEPFLTEWIEFWPSDVTYEFSIDFFQTWFFQVDLFVWSRVSSSFQLCSSWIIWIIRSNDPPQSERQAPMLRLKVSAFFVPPFMWKEDHHHIDVPFFLKY